jgi:hypothetical protein
MLIFLYIELMYIKIVYYEDILKIYMCQALTLITQIAILIRVINQIN